MTISLEPIKHRRVADLVFDQIKRLIDDKTLKPGSKLLPERELSREMDVSRTVVREAIQRLKAMGLLIQYQGRGTFVRAHDSNHDPYLWAMVDARHVSIKDFLEIRLGFECHAASLSAERADESDIRAMADSIEEMEAVAISGQFNIQADVKFHKAIANAAKNPLHLVVESTFNYRMVDNIQDNLKYLYERPETIPQVLSQHEKIFHHIRRRHAEKAYSAMKEHISFVLDLLTFQ